MCGSWNTLILCNTQDGVWWLYLLTISVPVCHIALPSIGTLRERTACAGFKQTIFSFFIKRLLVEVVILFKLIPIDIFPLLLSKTLDRYTTAYLLLYL